MRISEMQEKSVIMVGGGRAQDATTSVTLACLVIVVISRHDELPDTMKIRQRSINRTR
jgi:hypothetical protein